MIRRWINDHAGGDAVVLTGDLNVTDDNEGFRALVADDASPRLFDAYRQVHPAAGDDEATFHGFAGKTSGRRIDFVLGTAELRVTSADIVRASREGRYPSDHYPVSVLMHAAKKPAK